MVSEGVQTIERQGPEATEIYIIHHSKASVLFNKEAIIPVLELIKVGRPISPQLWRLRDRNGKRCEIPRDNIFDFMLENELVTKKTFQEFWDFVASLPFGRRVYLVDDRPSIQSLAPQERDTPHPKVKILELKPTKPSSATDPQPDHGNNSGSAIIANGELATAASADGIPPAVTKTDYIPGSVATPDNRCIPQTVVDTANVYSSAAIAKIGRKKRRNHPGSRLYTKICITHDDDVGEVLDSKTQLNPDPITGVYGRSYEQAWTYILPPRFKPPPSPMVDPTDSMAQMEIILRFRKAIYCTDLCLDKKDTQKFEELWFTDYFPPWQVDMACWSVLREVVRLHHCGYRALTFNIDEERYFRPSDMNMTFWERIEAIEDLFFAWKSVCESIMNGENHALYAACPAATSAYIYNSNRGRINEEKLQQQNKVNAMNRSAPEEEDDDDDCIDTSLDVQMDGALQTNNTDADLQSLDHYAGGGDDTEVYFKAESSDEDGFDEDDSDEPI